MGGKVDYGAASKAAHRMRMRYRMRLGGTSSTRMAGHVHPGSRHNAMPS